MNMEQNGWKPNPQETRGWEIVKLLNDGLKNGVQIDALSARKLLAEYIKLGCRKPSKLHSAILGCAIKMATEFSDFHFVPFIDMWNLKNLLPEDSDTRISEDGKRFPSLVERMIKAYAYSLMFHPDEYLDPRLEQTMKSTFQKKGYQVGEKDGRMQLTTHALVTRVFLSDVRNRKMTFVSLLTPDGKELVAEIHTITHHQRMRYEELNNRLFRVILRTSDAGKLRLEAAYPSNERVEDCFETEVGYVEHIDASHHHIHVYDNKSRHFVAKYDRTTELKEDTYVKFVPVIPRDSKFKSAIITSLCSREDFGYRKVTITYTNEEQGYCSWELLPEADGTVRPIIETGAHNENEPATKGYINKTFFDKIRKNSTRTDDLNVTQLPTKGDNLKIVTFLKRGKDGKKRPIVVDCLH